MPGNQLRGNPRQPSWRRLAIAVVLFALLVGGGGVLLLWNSSFDLSGFK